MSNIIKIVGLFIFCNGAGCNCSNNPNGGQMDWFQLWLGIVVYFAGIIARWLDPDEND